MGIGSVQTRTGVKAQEPHLGKRLEAGELLETQVWMKRYGRKKKK
jgi:hypothetical protein